MASLPILSVLEDTQVSPPPATIVDTSLTLTFFDFLFVSRPPIHYLYFYQLPLTKTQFVKTIVPNLKHSLSITLQHFFPFVGNLFIFPTSTKKLPEIRYVDGDFVKLTIAECNLDFDDLTGNHPRKCDMFHHLIPHFGQQFFKTSDYVKIATFSLQVTLFPNNGFSIGTTSHHSLGDASTQFYFLKAWITIARCGTNHTFLANGTLPVFDRLVNYPEVDKSFLKYAYVGSFFSQEYKPHNLSATDNVRATFVLTRTFIDRLKIWVVSQIPTSSHISSFVVVCAYIWCCMAKIRNDEKQMFIVPLDCRKRLDPPIPTSYFGNCLRMSISIAKTSLLTGNEGIIAAAKILGENIHKELAEKDGLVKDYSTLNIDEMLKTIIAISGTPKLVFYDMDFGWGKPKKFEVVSIDYSLSVSIHACKECNQDLEIGVSLTAKEMEIFICVFKEGLELHV
ncbi:malonyl-coenzyme A:anthocyanin 3-O-glucoside-6''-O-malonyltransferase-like [Rutidosis leptorrhynchoides]|uniref:malonyl-coenzyme A:anthocyanin 3-O-glucoside-6''-O-malonyltransferase-like n=1 Tax=Rutidosis leptorrhynchoides TaxID=125765 RepID=UPI003A99CAD3